MMVLTWLKIRITYIGNAQEYWEEFMGVLNVDGRGFNRLHASLFY